ncbi:MULTISPECIES: DUF2188 domain-containing protein [Cupriavidus]|uniref:DUF2188 domain-containing protein n=2 Tax=Cupriavidus TaxID=106589 RepID=A0A1C3UT55_9BURK|nr:MULTISPECIES: DUF2188 domain-containing protein [Cupriavidus]MBB2917839.1 hypothetical protein [Cupriavidus alkaliphilus]MBB3007433.1 hypothetical protein [Cupriavidus alkaliphilus]PVY77737.1 uncharacterized protein DUF2188 [Cupriavidus alkaliphilus]RAS06989.1 uncharacterized protein DUF2188 [Cupriavidus alkaliphilus]SCB18629.1 hypothetical protein GA0116996_104276 [Cupriavidus alkaliphilus]
MTSRSIHVLPASTGDSEYASEEQWALTIEGLESGPDDAALHFPTQEAAIAAGWMRAREDGVPLCIHGRDGLVRERKIYCRDARGNARLGR